MDRDGLSEITLEDVWPECAEHLQAAVAYGGDLHRMSDVRAAIEEGRAQLWPTPGGAVVTEVLPYPTGAKVLQFWLAGGSLKGLVAAEPVICDWGREVGCTDAHIVGRRGWVRALPDYANAGVILRKPLKGNGNGR